MAATNIPLHCNICPKKPNFSDVSHLLTHIASKGHLSNYYKVKVKSSTEDASRRLIETYDQWYAEWNVEDLMSERMNQKEKRRTRTRGTARTNPTPKVEAPVPRSMRARAQLNNNLLDPFDPRLTDHHTIKLENSVTPTPPPITEAALRPRGFAPGRQFLPPISRSTSRSITNPDYETSSEYSDPSERSRFHYNAQNSCAIEDDPVETATVSTEDTTTSSECTRLKGIYWPGMDIFDSATPEMRRKRNQKKDISVVEQLELNSQEVEPTEMIFTPQGSFKKQRRISGSVYDDSSPIRGDSPDKPRLQRPVLAEMDINAVRRPRPPIRPPIFPYISRNPFDDDPVQSEYGYGERRKRAFDVFQDHDVTFTRPASLNYLTSEYHRPSPPPTFAPYKTYHDPFSYDNKENVLPSFHQPQPFEHQEPAGFQFPTYLHDSGNDQPPMYGNPLYINPYTTNNPEEVDDQRTLTAPPSPSAGQIH